MLPDGLVEAVTDRLGIDRDQAHGLLAQLHEHGVDLGSLMQGGNLEQLLSNLPEGLGQKLESLLDGQGGLPSALGGLMGGGGLSGLLGGSAPEAEAEAEPESDAQA